MLLKRVGMGLVLALALVGALLIGSTVYRLVRLVSLLDAADLEFLHQARITVEAQQNRPSPPPKPAEAPPP